MMFLNKFIKKKIKVTNNSEYNCENCNGTGLIGLNPDYYVTHQEGIILECNMCHGSGKKEGK